MKTTREKIEVMQAFEKGEQIQVYNYTFKEWQDAEKTPLWDWVTFDYRIKPKTLDEIIKSEFEDGDILFIESFCSWILIYKENKNEEYIYKYVAVSPDTTNFLMFTNDRAPVCRKKSISEIRFATDDEKQKLFDVIKARGYHWNNKTKTLEKTKFDITTLKPFETKVLVRNYGYPWKPAIFGYYIKNSLTPYCVLGGTCWKQCIPYERNEYLLGTEDECDDFYKNWK